MQSLFAFDQCKEANYQLALDLIHERFLPDLNSMEVQDKDLLKKQKKTASKLFEDGFKGKPLGDESEPKILKAVQDAQLLYANQVKKDKDFLSKNIVLEIEKLNQVYYHILNLFIEFAHLGKSEKKIKHDTFSQSSIINALSENDTLKKELLKIEPLWQNHHDKVRGWFKEILKADSEYIEFISKSKTDDDAQKNMLKHINRKLILGTGPINDFFEELDLRWAEDKVIIRSLVDKTIKSFNDGKIEIQKLSLDWDDDKIFIDRLFKQTVDLDEKYKKQIAQNTKNWEVDRLPLTDRVIIEMALAEMINFPNIPVKVTINEYIELAKEYSTPNSRQFINGILDVLSKNLKESGDMKKSGRGLIDNK